MKTWVRFPTMGDLSIITIEFCLTHNIINCTNHAKISVNRKTLGNCTKFSLSLILTQSYQNLKFYKNFYNTFGAVRKLRHAKMTFLTPSPLSQIFQRKEIFVFRLSQILLHPPPPKRDLRTTSSIPLSNYKTPLIQSWIFIKKVHIHHNIQPSYYSRQSHFQKQKFPTLWLDVFHKHKETWATD